MTRATAWTPADDAHLRQLLDDGLSYIEAGAHLGRSLNAVISRCRLLGPDFRSKVKAGRRTGSRRCPPVPVAIKQETVWTEEMDAALRAAWTGRAKSKQIAHDLGVSFLVMRNRARKLGLGERVNSQYWSATEDAELRAGVARGDPAHVIGARIGRSEQGVWVRASKLGAKRGRAAVAKPIVAPPPAPVVIKQPTQILAPGPRPAVLAGDDISWSAITLRGTPYDAKAISL